MPPKGMMESFIWRSEGKFLGTRRSLALRQKKGLSDFPALSCLVHTEGTTLGWHSGQKDETLNDPGLTWTAPKVCSHYSHSTRL